MRKTRLFTIIALLVVIALIALVGCSDKSYTVSFDSTGGQAVDPMEISFKSVDVNKSYVLPIIARESVVDSGITYKYNFDGWYLKNQKYATITITDFSNDTTLVAKWEKQVVFGQYPQTLVDKLFSEEEQNEKNSLIASLNSLAGEKPVANDDKDWVNYNFYIGGEIQSYMWYKDVEFEGAKYRGVYAIQQRTDLISHSTISAGGFADSSYNLNVIYWFKWEPIAWDIVTDQDGNAQYLLSDLVLDAQAFSLKEIQTEYDHNGGTGFANNYELSDIRKWINNDFVNTAFNSAEQGAIQLTTVDNSLVSTGNDHNMYTCNNTFDKVFLLSSSDFKALPQNNKIYLAKASDYALALKLNHYDNDYASWWLRTPTSEGNNALLSADDYFAQYAQYITNSGVNINDYVDRIANGVRPAISLANLKA